MSQWRNLEGLGYDTRSGINPGAYIDRPGMETSGAAAIRINAPDSLRKVRCVWLGHILNRIDARIGQKIKPH